MLSEEQLALSFNYYFNWGYPDYIKHALSILLNLKAKTNNDQTEVENPSNWVEVRQLMDEAETDPIKYLVAGNQKTPAAVLDFLSKDSSAKILEHIALNTHTHTITLKRLSEHPDAVVRAAVAQNANTPEDVLETLARDICPDVRYSIAESIDAPTHLLSELAEDENPYVSLRANRTLQNLRGTQIIEGQFGNISTEKKRKIN